MRATSGSSTRLRNHKAGGAAAGAYGGGLWIALLLTTAAWGLAAPTYFAAGRAWPVVLAAAAAFAWWEMRRTDGAAAARGWAVCALPAAALALTLPHPFSLAAWVLVIASLSVLLPAGRHWLRALPKALLFCAAAFLCAALLHVPYVKLESRYYDWSPLAAPAGWIARALGWKALVADGRLYMARDASLVDFPAQTATFLYYPMPLFVALGLLAAALGGWRRAIAFLAIVGAYAVARFILLASMAPEWGGTELFWRPAILTVSFLPLALVLWRAMPFHLPLLREPHRGAGAGTRCVALALTAGVLLTASVLLGQWADAGVRKAGRVLIDEKHSGWTLTWPPPDTKTYGMLSTYNYSAMAELLAHHYRVTINFSRALDDGLLSQCDVLVLKLPSASFSQQEVDSIVRFVRRGGGLWLIGDHTNVFGSAVYLNQVCRPLGLSYRTECTWDLVSRQMNMWVNDSPLPPSPALGGMMHFEFENGCTLRLPLLADDMMLCRDVLAQEANYSTEVFFPVRELGDTNVEIGARVLMGGVRYGLGRVVAFTDSTCFSTFAMTGEGRRDMVLCSVEWANRMNRPQWPARAALAVGLALLLAAGWYGVRAGQAAAVAALSAGLLALAAPVWAAKHGRPDLRPPLRQDVPAARLVLLRQDGGAVFENLDPAQWAPDRDPMASRRYSTFAINTQRVGVLPIPADDVPAPEPGVGLALVRPNRAYAARDVGAIKRFVDAGGLLLILASNDSEARDPTEGVVRAFGLSYGPRTAWLAPLIDGSGRYVATANRPRTIRGGRPVLATRNHGVVLAETRYGRGRVLVFGDGQSFGNPTLGHHFEVPTGYRKEVVDLEYRLLEYLFGRDVLLHRPKPTIVGTQSVPVLEPTNPGDWLRPAFRPPQARPVEPLRKQGKGGH